MYVKPESVLSPKASVGEDIYVLYDGKEKSYSIALIDWEGKPVLAMRWNGFKDNKGHPVVRGIPVWFVVPNDLRFGIISDVIKKIESDKEKERFFFLNAYLRSLVESKFTLSYEISLDDVELNSLQKQLSRVSIFIDMTQKNRFGSTTEISFFRG